MVIGLLVIALPVIIIGGNFDTVHNFQLLAPGLSGVVVQPRTRSNNFFECSDIPT